MIVISVDGDLFCDVCGYESAYIKKCSHCEEQRISGELKKFVKDTTKIDVTVKAL